MHSLFPDTRVETAISGWAGIAVSLGLDPTEFTHKLVWQKDEARRSHVVLRLVSPTRQLILKQVFRAEGNKDVVGAITAQRDAAERLSAYPNAHAPAVLWMSDDGWTTVMEAVPGKTLDQHLTDDRPPKPVLKRTGAWLAAFHRTSEEGRRKYKPRFMVNHIQHLRDQVDAGEIDLPEPKLFSACAAQIPRIAAEFEGRLSVSCAKHGDFNLRNIILGPTGATGIDFAPHQTAPVGFDISRILLDYAELFQRSQDVPQGAVLAPQTLEAFFSGYDLVTPDDPGVGFLSYVQLLKDWRAVPSNKAERSWRQARRFDTILALAHRAFDLPT